MRLRSDENGLPYDAVEAFLFENDSVGAQGQVGRKIHPVFVRSKIDFAVRLDLYDLNLRTRNSGSAGVRYQPFNSASVGLRQDRAAHRHENEQEEHLKSYSHSFSFNSARLFPAGLERFHLLLRLRGFSLHGVDSRQQITYSALVR